MRGCDYSLWAWRSLRGRRRVSAPEAERGAAGRAGGALAGQSGTLEKGTLVQRRRTDRARTRSAAEGQRKKVAVASNLVAVPNNQGCEAAVDVPAGTPGVKKLAPEAAAAATGGTKPGKAGAKATVPGWFQVKLLGLDVFDPATMETDHRPGDDVPCWLLDTDYSGLCFHVCQAFFPRTAARGRPQVRAAGRVRRQRVGAPRRHGQRPIPARRARAGGGEGD